MPYDFLQPLDLDFRWEDRHVIAFFDGHPAYEATEAFVAARAGHGPLVRAILTRHDKSQVDVLNDPAAVDAWRAAHPSREAYGGAIAFSTTFDAGNPHAVLAFTSPRGEEVVVDVAGTTPALPAFGGLTDPLGHAPDVIPVLYRDASAVGSPRSRVTIDKRPYTIPRFFTGTTELGVTAFYTEGFAVGVVSTGTRTFELLEAPETLAVGARWRFADRAYELVALAGDRAVVVRTSGVRETVEAHVRDGRMCATRITVASGSERAGALVASFDPALPGLAPAGRDAGATFAIAVDEHPGLISGRIVPGDAAFDLLPDQPAWATHRVLHVGLVDHGRTRTVRSSIPARPG